jgi:cell division septation protein DedD
MADQNIREIQVSGKQLVFLFMASVVVAVAIFLLGVSVGRGVRDATGGTPALEASAAGSAETAPAPDKMPPATELSAQDQTFAKNLQQGGPSPSASSGASAPASAAAPPTTDAPEVSEPESASSSQAPAARTASNAAPPAATTPKPSAQTPPKAAEPAPSSKTSLPAALQVNAFRSRENADKEVAQLKAKGYPAFVLPSQAGGLFRVRVGPYSQRADADRVAARMRQEGLKPSVTR